MDIDRLQWNAVQPHLDRALELSEPERVSYVASLSATDPALAALLASLLESGDAAHTPVLLRQLASTSMAPRASIAERWQSGDQVGAYALDAPLGRGGMGEVWRARRIDGRFEGAVAIKCLATDQLSSSDHARFRREGVALARLTHPGIARLLDAGVSDGGTPYLVLELVTGEPLHGYCDQRSLDVTSRIRLVCDVLDAVAHAHGQLVVHRDMKPSNILVTEDGRVKLLDFGIATLLDPQSVGALTAPDARALTPAYASPEQVSGAAAATSTDIYSVGVVLYQLLTGRHPTAEGATTAGEILRRIVKGAVVRPSQALRAADADASTITTARRTTVSALATRLRGDLDVILERALSLEPAARYASAAAFADDLRRHLALRPVRARPDTPAYRLSRFLRRNTATVTLAVLALVGILGASGVALRESARARQQRDAALEQADRLRATNDFQFFLISQVGQENITLAELLGRADKLLRTYAMPTQSRAYLLAQVAEQYSAIGSDSLAVRIWRRIDSLLVGVPDDQVDPNLTFMAADLYNDVGQRDRAARLLATARSQMARTAIQSPDLLTRAYLTTSSHFSSTKQSDSALHYAKAAVALLEQEGLQASNRYLSAVSRVASILSGRRERRGGVEAYEATIPTLAATGSELSLNAVITHANIAYIRQQIGEVTLADRFAAEARRRLGVIDSSGGLPPQFLLTLANNALLQERWDEAEGHWTALIDVSRRIENNFLIWRGQHGLARTAALRGDPVRARLWQRASFVTGRQLRPNPRDSTALDGLILLAEGQPARAAAELDRYFADSLFGTIAWDLDTVHVALYRAEAALAAGPPARAVDAARAAVQRATVDSVSARRSAFWGAAKTLESLALEAAGDRAGACTAARLATAPLTFGYGPTVRMRVRREETERRVCGTPAS